MDSVADDIHDSILLQRAKTSRRPTPNFDHRRDIDGCYDAGEEVGSGYFGRVHRRMSRTGNHRAVKFVPYEQLVDEQVLGDLKVELQVLLQLRHPHIISIYEWFEDPIVGFYLVTEYCDGGTLKQFFEVCETREERPPLQRMLKLFHELAQAVSYCHAQNIIHRDLKPENCLLSGGVGVESVLKVCDFGLAEICHTTTPLHRVAGTEMYAAPEMHMGKPYNKKIDIWSIGVILFEMLTVHLSGKAIHPFDPWHL